ncbi:hypothetical protein STSP2_00712 [Anaerohalosphaera lusitana]|uniref:Uncharacterized protein n=1 Tax=Anaerohalosphaera lusitana TaxID=1936003 RepID=A0A1U9NIK9_9BACT|nr:hypothetical protein [Anaerohalosphaera lusitana]AQT67564.1 hypothetical protein STSP2_00712 [Anaerohalosphaera lusitana]
MPPVLTILKKRWQEVLLIAILGSGIFIPSMLLGLNDAAGQEPEVSEWSLFAMVAGVTFFAVFYVMITMGFLETAYREGTYQQDPAKLLIIGRRFFWRMLRFNIIIGLVSSVIIFAFYVVIHRMILQLPPDEAPSVWVQQISAFFTSIIVARPVLLIPPIFITTGTNEALKAFSLSKKFPVKSMVGPIVIYVVCQAVANGLMQAWPLMKDTGPIRYIPLAVIGVAAGLLFFVPYLPAMKYITERMPSPPEREDPGNE